MIFETVYAEIEIVTFVEVYAHINCRNSVMYLDVVRVYNCRMMAV